MTHDPCSTYGPHLQVVPVGLDPVPAAMIPDAPVRGGIGSRLVLERPLAPATRAVNHCPHAGRLLTDSQCVVFRIGC